MTAFADQRAQLIQAFVREGMSADGATAIANILANSRQTMTHSGQVYTDTTPQGMAYVGPDARKHVYKNIDFREGDRDYRPQQTRGSEEAPVPVPPGNVTAETAPQSSDAKFRVADGSLVSVRSSGDSVSVNLKNRVARQPESGLPVAMLDTRTNEIVGKGLRVNSQDSESRLRFNATESPQDLSLDLTLDGVDTYDVITGLEYVPGQGLRYKTSRIAAWNERHVKEKWIRVKPVDVITDLVDDQRGTRGHAMRIASFEAHNTPDVYFNTFRVGKFSGGWLAGETKTVSQDWPQGGVNVEVYNATHDIADTPEEKIVLFCARSEDQVNPNGEVRGELENPVPLYGAGPVPAEPVMQNAPAHKFWALEIQPSSDCTAFSYLDGKKLSDLSGYDDTIYQALGHSDGAESCISWVGEELEFVTDVYFAGGVMYKTVRTATVLHAGAPSNVAITSFETVPVNVVQNLSVDGSGNIVGTRAQVGVWWANPASDSIITTVSADALESLSLGGSGLYASKNTLRVIKVDVAAGDVVATTDCPEA